MTKYKVLPPLSVINSHLSYDPETGVLRRKQGGRIIGLTGPKGYRYVSIEGENYYVHRIVWLIVYGMAPIEDIDHIDGKKGNNKIANLREATHRQNKFNVGIRKSNLSGFKGVSWCKRDRRWRATIRIDGVKRSLGYFISKELAAEAYKEAAIKYHGEYANTAGPQSLDLS